MDESSGKIDASADISSFFGELVSTAIRERGVTTSPASEHYLVGLLVDCAQPGAKALDVVGADSITLMLARALEENGPVRFERLRLLGDGLLYVSGFFGQHLERRGLEPDYVCDLGSTAYGRAASMLRRRGSADGGPDVLAELSVNFDTFVQVTSDVSEQLSALSVRDHSSLLEVYERWLKTESATLADLLLAQGLLPVRGKPGLH